MKVNKKDCGCSSNDDIQSCSHGCFFNEFSPQSKELTRGPPPVSSALSFIGGVHNRRKTTLCPKFYTVWLNLSPTYPSGEEGGNFFVQMIFTSFRNKLIQVSNVLIWDKMLSSGANVIMWDEMLPSGIKFFIWS
jgi:hypothetical protein